jgi:hypothetical protein
MGIHLLMHIDKLTSKLDTDDGVARISWYNTVEEVNRIIEASMRS